MAFAAREAEPWTCSDAAAVALTAVGRAFDAAVSLFGDCFLAGVRLSDGAFFAAALLVGAFFAAALLVGAFFAAAFFAAAFLAGAFFAAALLAGAFFDGAAFVVDGFLAAAVVAGGAFLALDLVGRVGGVTGAGDFSSVVESGASSSPMAERSSAARATGWTARPYLADAEQPTTG